MNTTNQSGVACTQTGVAGSHHHGGCCGVIEVLAHAAAAIHDHHCCCERAADEAGCACCKQSLISVLDAIDAQTKHLRGACEA